MEAQRTAREEVAIGLYAFAGGFGDAVGYLLVHTFAGHVTGNLVLLALSLTQGHWQGVLWRLLAVATFLVATGLGFSLSAWKKREVAWLLFLVQGCALGGLCLSVVRSAETYQVLLVLALSLVLGLQNGVIISAAKVSVHSTFLSGDVTTFMKIWSASISSGVKSVEEQARQKLTTRMILILVISFMLGASFAGIITPKLGSLTPPILVLPLLAAAIVTSWNAQAVVER